jgi:hypothetical protein
MFIQMCKKGVFGYVHNSQVIRKREVYVVFAVHPEKNLFLKKNQYLRFKIGNRCRKNQDFNSSE